LSFLIELKNVSKIYSLGQEKYSALKEVNLTIERGEMTAIIGQSGSGKSTLMNILGFLDHCTQGQYLFTGNDVSRLSAQALATIRNQRIGFVFQSFFLLARANALHNVMLPLFYRGVPTNEARELALAMLDKVGVAHLYDHRPNQLSGGQQQRVAIARALVGDPDIILADEPTGALDSQTGHEVMQLFERLHHEEGRTLLVITHDPHISARCKRVITIKDGKIKAD
jgi:putative ABC transport system ATP-binding protein